MGFILINRQGRACQTVSRKVPADRWVLDHPLVPDDTLIRDDCQGRMCRAVLRKVLDNRWVPDDPLVLNDPLIRDK